jgi:hypothetical protein
MIGLWTAVQRPIIGMCRSTFAGGPCPQRSSVSGPSCRRCETPATAASRARGADSQSLLQSPSEAIVRAPDSGIILRASGVEGTKPWRLEVVAAQLLEEAESLLEPTDISPPAL